MSEPNKDTNLVDITDCLEAVGVFKFWKNSLFLILLAGLIILHLSFWLFNSGYIKASGESTKQATVLAAQSGTDLTAVTSVNDVNSDAQIIKEATAIVADANNAVAGDQEVQKKDKRILPLKISMSFSHLCALIKTVNFIIIPVAILYCLTLLFILKVSLVGRLGGISHISRAFFVSLIFVVLLMPWQKLAGSYFCGVLYSPDELLNSFNKLADGWLITKILYYCRFVLYWLLAFLLLLSSHIRSCKWASQILKRLGVI
ncbi:MAG: hypothetical protein H8D47_00050 [Planctomycetes bacterium]|nr:hypothetical protein [Planctomycetota bacterium]